MITISLTQGLGNQLFQYFFGESLRIEFQNNIEVNYLNDLLPPEQIKLWELFDLEINWIDKTKLKKNFLFDLSPKNRNFILNFYKILRLNYSSLLIDDLYFDSSSLKTYKDTYFRGYWQNYNFIKKNFDKISKKIKFKKKLSLNKLIKYKTNKIKHTTIIGVHVRGGDYLLNQNRLLKNDINADYYINSMNLMKSIFDQPLFLLFTDDFQYLKNLNISKNFDCINIFDISNERDDDFQYLSQCNNFIIPNSTFSLWAFYLNNHENKFILTPDTWYSFKKNCIDNFIEKKYLKMKYDYIKKYF